MLLAKADKSFYKNLLTYLKDVDKNTKSPDKSISIVREDTAIDPDQPHYDAEPCSKGRIADEDPLL